MAGVATGSRGTAAGFMAGHATGSRSTAAGFMAGVATSSWSTTAGFVAGHATGSWSTAAGIVAGVAAGITAGITTRVATRVAAGGRGTAGSRSTAGFRCTAGVTAWRLNVRTLPLVRVHIPVTRTSNRRFATSRLTVFSTAAALAAAGTEQPCLSRRHHPGQCHRCTEHPDPFHLAMSPSQGNRSFDRPDCHHCPRC